MKLTQCSALVAIADTGNFTRAARALGVSQSAVSHAIAAMEEELGCALLERDRAGVRLTDTGRGVIVHARAVLVHVEQIRHITAVGVCGTIRFATSQSFATRLLPTLLSEFHTQFPRFEIALREGTGAQIAQWLRGNAIDVGIVTMPQTDLTTIPLLRDELHVLMPHDHHLAAHSAVHIGQLEHEVLVMPVGDVEPVLRAALRMAGFEPIVAHRMRDLNALTAMVAQGLGITVLPALALPSGSTDLRAVPLTPTITRQVAIGVRDVVRNSPGVKAFVATARDVAARTHARLPLSA